MALVKDAAKLPWEEKPTPREGRIQIKRLAKGKPGAPDNFEFNLYRFHPGYATPRHRHNFEQMRFGLSGSLTYVPRKTIVGSLVYFPEGAYYGPQDTSDISDVLLLQYGGASGQGYMSQDQLIAARAEMAKSGTFENGIYSYTDAAGKRHNKDSVEACYEFVFGQPVHYAKPRIPEAVKFDVAAHNWVPGTVPGLFEKLLAVLTERRVEARVVEARSPANLDLDEQGRQLVYGLEGAMEIDGADFGPQSSVFSDKGEATKLRLKQGWQGLIVQLPRW